jgi:hypothetical protein
MHGHSCQSNMMCIALVAGLLRDFLIRLRFRSKDRRHNMSNEEIMNESSQNSRQRKQNKI